MAISLLSRVHEGFHVHVHAASLHPHFNVLSVLGQRRAVNMY